MSLWSRITNVLRGERLSREIYEELELHIQQAIEQGRDPAEARKTFGPALRHLDESHDLRVVTWLDSLRSDAVLGWRQLMKRKVTSAAAIVSLALAIGACTSAFRLIDALLLRPLPVAEPEQLFAMSYQGIGFDGKRQIADNCEYPMFRVMRFATKDQAELLAISYADRRDVTHGSDEDMEKAYLQYVSGWMFNSFGLKPAIGRLLTEDDDRKAGAYPYAVLSYDYWKRRFAGDPKIIGHTFRLGNELFVIVGVLGKGFTGIEPGTMTDIFVPTMMNPYVEEANSTWLRIIIRLKPGVAVESVREKLQGAFRTFREQQAKTFLGRPKQIVDNYLNQRILLTSATAGVSGMQRDYRQSLAALSMLVALVLLIACANVANLMTAQAAARAREMALRVSIGAGRWRLVQLVLIECTLLGFLAAGIGGLFAGWSAPFVVGRINPPEHPARFSLPGDWRVFGFAVVLTLCVTLLFGLVPALRASDVKPASALKGGDDPHSRRRLMYALIGVQTIFCVLVLFAAGLFVASFDRLSKQPLGLSTKQILTLDLVPIHPQVPGHRWDEVAEHLRTVPGVETVALASFALLSGPALRSQISVNGRPPIFDPAWFLDVSPGWLAIMNIPLINGRDFRFSDGDHNVAIVNEAFAKRYFGGENPVGKSFDRLGDRLEIVGLVRNACYNDIREPFSPVAYYPFRSLEVGLRPRRFATLVVRTLGSDPLALAATLRKEVSRANSGFRVSTIRTQEELVQAQTVRERLLAKLALFFAIVALVLASVGLYGVLEYSVLQRRREIAIRLAVGAQAGDVAWRVTVDAFTMVLIGGVAGLALGMASVRYITALLFQVKATDAAMLVFPSLTIFGIALLAALPAVIRAIRCDPVSILRAE